LHEFTPVHVLPSYVSPGQQCRARVPTATPVAPVTVGAGAGADVLAGAAGGGVAPLSTRPWSALAEFHDDQQDDEMQQMASTAPPPISAFFCFMGLGSLRFARKKKLGVAP
jgi:hypothetical protein